MSSTAAGSSNARSANRARLQGQQKPICPFCKTATMVERVSMTDANPGKKFYTCKNRDWNPNACGFFMWKPASSEGCIEETVARLEQDNRQLKKEIAEAKDTIGEAVSTMARAIEELVKMGMNNRWKQLLGCAVIGLLLLNLILLILVLYSLM